MIKGKRGGIGSFVSDFWAYVVFVLVIIIFSVFFGIQSKETAKTEITGLESKSNADLTLLNYLRTPISIKIDSEIRNMPMADLIVLSQELHQEENSRGILALNKSKELLDPIFGINNWAINICFLNEDRQSNQRCWLYLNQNAWQNTLKGKDGNLLSESFVVIPDMKDNEVNVSLRILK